METRPDFGVYHSLFINHSIPITLSIHLTAANYDNNCILTFKPYLLPPKPRHKQNILRPLSLILPFPFPFPLPLPLLRPTPAFHLRLYLRPIRLSPLLSHHFQNLQHPSIQPTPRTQRSQTPEAQTKATQPQIKTQIQTHPSQPLPPIPTAFTMASTFTSLHHPTGFTNNQHLHVALVLDISPITKIT